MLQDPSLLLIFKGAYETTTGFSPTINDCRTKDAIRRASAKLELIAQTSRRIGVRETLEKFDSVDFFFCVLDTAFKSLQAEIQPPIPSILHNTMSSCSKLPHQIPAMRNDKSPIYSGTQNSQSKGQTLDGPQRAKLSDSARERLEQWFQNNFEHPYPTKEQKLQLAQECAMRIGQVCYLFRPDNEVAYFNC